MDVEWKKHIQRAEKVKQNYYLKEVDIVKESFYLEEFRECD